jgi:hypothetical protein
MPMAVPGLAHDVVTPERFAQGMAFAEYLDFIGTPANLAREAGWWRGPERMDWSALLREWHGRLHLRPAQVEAIRWLAAQPDGPARILVISEEWSSDCRRDVGVLARLAEAGGLDLRIFVRDGEKVGREPRADPAASPNADLVNAFLNENGLRRPGGTTCQSIPVAAFFTRDFEYLWHYVERPAIYRHGALSTAMQRPRPGESPAAARERFLTDWGALQQGPFFPMWALAAADEILSALHELALGLRPSVTRS